MPATAFLGLSSLTDAGPPFVSAIDTRPRGSERLGSRPYTNCTLLRARADRKAVPRSHFGSRSARGPLWAAATLLVTFLCLVPRGGPPDYFPALRLQGATRRRAFTHTGQSSFGTLRADRPRQESSSHRHHAATARAGIAHALSDLRTRHAHGVASNGCFQSGSISQTTSDRGAPRHLRSRRVANALHSHQYTPRRVSSPQLGRLPA